jgi:ParB family chromosome partitioning protein
MTTTVRLEEIHVGARHRKDLGDIAALAHSIEAVGLLQPPVVTADLQLIAGVRRLEALRQLGRREVDVYVAVGLDDAVAQVLAERDENTCRKELTPSEAVAFAAALEALEKEKARQRQTAGVNQHTEASGKLPEGSRGQTRDKVGAALGMSGRTYEKAKAVVEAARADPEKYGGLQEQMDRTGRVNGVYRRLKIARQAEVIEAEPPPLPQGPFRVIVADPPWQYHKRPGDPSRNGSCDSPACPWRTSRRCALPGWRTRTASSGSGPTTPTCARRSTC